MITWLLTLCTILIVGAVAEIQIWSFTLNRHAWWMKTHPTEEKRCINYKGLMYTSTFTSLVSALTLFSWICIITMGCSCPVSYIILVSLFVIAMLGTVVLIGYLSLIAKLCRLNKYYYPPLTVWVCKKWNSWAS